MKGKKRMRRFSVRLISVVMSVILAAGSVAYSAAETGTTPYKWTRISSNEELRRTLIELSGKEESQLEKTAQNEDDYNSRILIVTKDGNKDMFLSSDVYKGSSGDKYLSNNAVKLSELEKLSGEVGQDTIYTAGHLSTPFIKIAQGEALPKSNDIVMDFTYSGNNTYSIHRSSGDDYYRSASGEIMLGAQYAVEGTYITNSLTMCRMAEYTASGSLSLFTNPVSFFDFDNDGMVKIGYRFSFVKYNLNRKQKSVSSSSYIAYSKAVSCISMTGSASSAASFYIYLGTPVSYEEYLKMNPKDDKKKETETKPEVIDDKTYRYKWTRVKSSDDFSKLLREIESDELGKDIFDINKNISNSKGYTARIMIVTAKNSSNSLLFKDGKLTSSALPSDIKSSSEKFYTDGNYGLPFTKIVESGRGESSSYLALRLSSDDVMTDEDDTLIGVSSSSDKYGLVYKKASAVSGAVFENSFLLSFYDSNSDKVHIAANIPDNITGKYMSAKNSSISFVSSTEIQGTAEGSFYVFLGQPLTETEYNLEISGQSAKKNETKEEDIYYEWNRVESTADLDAILSRNGFAYVLIVPKTQTGTYLRSNVKALGKNYSNLMTLGNLADMGAEALDEKTMTSDTLMDAFIVRKTGYESINWNDDASAVSQPGGYYYEFLRNDGNNNVLSANDGNCFLAASYCIDFGKDDYSRAVTVSAQAGFPSSCSTSNSNNAKNDSRDRRYYSDIYRTWIFTRTTLSISKDGARICWPCNVSFNGNAIICDGSKTVGSGRHKTTMPNWIYGYRFASFNLNQYLRCDSNQTYVDGVHLSPVAVTGDSTHFASSGNNVVGAVNDNTTLFYLYIAKAVARPAYSGDIGGINGNFEGTLYLTDNAVIRTDKTLTVNEGNTLVINGTVRNCGSIRLNGGTLIVNGELKNIGSAPAATSYKKILAEKGSTIIVMEGGAITGYSTSNEDWNNTRDNYDTSVNSIMLSKNSSMSVFGLVYCLTVNLYETSSLTVQPGGMLIANRYSKANPPINISAYSANRNDTIGKYYGAENFLICKSVAIAKGSSVTVYGLLFGGITCDSSSTKPSNYQYTVDSYTSFAKAMQNW